jgi:trehalose 6-phosphate phosphatase
MTDDPVGAGLPRAATPEGQAALAAVLAAPGDALIASDFDGTLSPIVTDPGAAHAHPGAIAALRRLAGRVGTLAVVTGRPVAQAVQLGGLTGVPGIIVLGHYGWERWQDGQVTSPPSPPGINRARQELSAVLAGAGAPDGVWVEDKGHALAVHTRRAADPDAALAGLREPLETLATRTGLAVEPGRRVIELRPPGMDKGVALTDLARQRRARSVLFFGDDLGDLAAFAAVRALRGQGTSGATIVSAAPESELAKDEGDFTVDGPDGVAEFLEALADLVGGDDPPGPPDSRGGTSP